MQIPCGGWRRPHSYYLGDLPEIKNCFAYVKVHTLSVYLYAMAILYNSEFHFHILNSKSKANTYRGNKKVLNVCLGMNIDLTLLPSSATKGVKGGENKSLSSLLQNEKSCCPCFLRPLPLLAEWPIFLSTLKHSLYILSNPTEGYV